MNRASPSEFYKRFRDDPEAAQREAFRAGEAIGRRLVAELRITGDDLQALAKVLNAFGRKTGTLVTVRGDKVESVNTAFCPMMTSALTLNIPWKWLCQNLGWPMIRGIAHAVNPKADLKIGSWRADGASVCEHFVEIK